MDRETERIVRDLMEKCGVSEVPLVRGSDGLGYTYRPDLGPVRPGEKRGASARMTPDGDIEHRDIDGRVIYDL